MLPRLHSLNEQAFGRPAEAQLIDTLRARGRIILSLVAVRNDHVVGHILFSPVTIETEKAALPVAGLAPMAIVPTLQRQGIGSLLVKAGLDACRKAGLAGVVVLGHGPAVHIPTKFGTLSGGYANAT